MQTQKAKFWKAAKASDATRTLANNLFEGASRNSPKLDDAIRKHTENWRLERISAIDRAILRLAIFELNVMQTPPKVVLNEAIELTKKFSGEDSGRFVNGILDAFWKAQAKS